MKDLYYKMFHFDVETDPTPPVANQPAPEPTPEPPKTFTQEEVNALNAKTKTAERMALLKELGIEDAKDAKEALKKYKEQEDAKKTESEKLQEALKAEQTKATTAEQRATIAEAQLEAVKLGVPADKASKLVKLAMTYDGETVSDKINAVLKEFPEFKGGAKLDKFGNPVENTPKNKETDLTELFKKELMRS